jgi:hypothetical protein
MATRELPPLDYLRQCLRYEAHTGLFYWLHRPVEMFASEGIWKSWNTRMAGKPAITTSNGRGYYTSSVGGKMVMAHRIAWLMGTGRIPEGQIDHINGVTTDNRLVNLRDVSHAENSRNRKLNENSTSNAHGVRQHPKSSFWEAKIKFDGRDIFLGSFLTRDEAVACRQGAERALGFHPNHGRPA